MRRVHLVILGALLLMAPPGFADETLEIPLALPAPVNPWDFQTVDFSLPVPGEAVTSLQLRLVGTCQNQIYICGEPYNQTTRAARLEFRIGDDIVLQAENTVLHTFPTTESPVNYSILIGLYDMFFMTGEFLSDEAGQIGLAYNPLDGGYIGTTPCGAATLPVTVSSAVLVVNYNPALPATHRTWDALKGLYR